MRRGFYRYKFAAYRPVIGPLLVLLVIFVLSFTLGRALWTRVLETRDELKSAQARRQVLEEKVLSLQGLSEQSLRDRFRQATLAIPGEDPTLFALATIRELATEQNLAVNNLRIITREGSGEEFKGVKAVELRFDLEGGLLPTLAFLSNLRESAPLMRVTEVRFVVSGVASLANLKVLSVWGPLPESIGKLDTPVELLSSAETELLERLAELRKPEIGEIVPSPPQGRENPFAF